MTPKFVKYHDYLKTRKWRALKYKMFIKYRKCQKCGSRRNLDIHHKTYANLGNESLEDLQLLCHECHFLKHNLEKGFFYLKPSEILHLLKVTIVNAYSLPDRIGKRKRDIF